MKRKNKCGHKAGADCIICNEPNDLGNTEMAQHLALIFKLIDLTPTLLAMQMVDQEAATTKFTEALGFEARGVQPDGEVVNRLCKMVLTATNIAAQMVRLTDNRAEITLGSVPPQWTGDHLLAARMLVAAANNDPMMVSDLMVAGIAGRDAIQQVQILSSVLYLQIAAAWKSREVAKAKAASI